MNNWGLEGVKTLGCPLSWTRLTECDEHNVKWLNQSLRTDFKVAAKAETFYVQISLKCRRIYDLGCYLTRLPCKGEQKVSCVLCLGCGRQRFTLKPFITICLMFLVIKQTVNTYSRWELSHFTVEQTSSPSCGGVCCPFGPGVPPGPYCRSVWNVKSSPSLEVRKRSLLDCIMLIGLWQSRGGGQSFLLCVLQMTFLWDAALLRWVVLLTNNWRQLQCSNPETCVFAEPVVKPFVDIILCLKDMGSSCSANELLLIASTQSAASTLRFRVMGCVYLQAQLNISVCVSVSTSNFLDPRSYFPDSFAYVHTANIKEQTIGTKRTGCCQ